MRNIECNRWCMKAVNKNVRYDKHKRDKEYCSDEINKSDACKDE
jgi:hypothetical protein